MGASQSTYRLSHSTCEDDTCNCFCNDKAVQTQYNVPNPTTNCYPKTSDLTNKTLCCKWHRYFFEHSRAPAHCLSIVLINTTSDCDLPGRQIRAYFSQNCHHLPVLQSDRNPKSDDDSVKRTLHIDGCTVPVNVANMDLNSMQSAGAYDVHVFLLDGKTDIDAVTHAIQTSTSSCILVQTSAKRKSSYIHLAKYNQLCRNYNVPCLKLSLNSKKSMKKLFVFAIKYYWFCAVTAVST
eukprot:189856_1